MIVFWLSFIVVVGSIAYYLPIGKLIKKFSNKLL